MQESKNDPLSVQNTENKAAFKEMIKGTVIGERWGKVCQLQTEINLN